MVLREIITKWGIQTDDSGLKKMESGINDVKSSLVKIAAAGAAAAGVLFGIAKSVADIGDETAKTAKSLGINAQSLQELQFAAAISGVKTNDFNNSLKKFSKNILEARRGTVTYTRAFKQLGIGTDVINNKQLKTEDLLGIMAEAFSKMEAGVEKTGLAMELFGRSGPRLLPLMNEGRKGIEALRLEATALGGVMGKTLLADSEEFQDSILRMTTVFAGIRNEIAAKLIPIINKVTDSIKIWFLANREMITQKLDKYIETLIGVSKIAFKIFNTMFKSISGLVSIFGGLENVIRTVTFSMMFLFGAQLLIGIGNMTRGIYLAVISMRTLGNAALIAQAKALAVPLLIGAAMVALGLIMNDIAVFFMGGDSITGQIVDSFKSMLEILSFVMTDVFTSLGQWLVDIISVPTQFLIDKLNWISDKIKSLTSGFDIAGSIQSAGDSILSTIGLGPSTSDGGLSPTGNSSSSSIVQKNEIIVNVPAGLSPTEAAEATRLGTEDALSSLFRKTDRAVSSPILE